MTKLLDTGEPYYRQIADRLRDMVLDLPSGERLPSEPMLAKSFKVSRFTVAKAVEQLVNDGLIYRKQGSGTFVAEAPLRRQPGYLLSFTEAVQAAGHLATHSVLEFRRIPWSAGLPYAEDEGLVLLDRLRLVDGIAVARHRSVLSAELVERIGLTEAVVRRADFSLYSHFADSGLQVASANERLIARLANEAETRLLGLSRNAVVVAVNRQTFAADGTPLDAVDATYDARHYSYEARLTRGAEPGNEKINKEQRHDIQKLDPDGHNGPRLGPWDGRDTRS